MQLCEEKPTISDEAFTAMIGLAKEELKSRQQQMALVEADKQRKLVSSRHIVLGGILTSFGNV